MPTQVLLALAAPAPGECHPVSDNLLVNKEIIRQGYGHAYVKYPFDPEPDEEFRAAGRQRENVEADSGWTRVSPSQILRLRVKLPRWRHTVISAPTAAVGSSCECGSL